MPDRNNRFMYEKLGELGIDDSEASGKPLIDDDDLTTDEASRRPAPRLTVKVNRIRGKQK